MLRTCLLGRPPLIGALTRALADAATGGFNPMTLFANGEQGALFYPDSTFVGLYQDSAGTTPVTAVEQPVGLVLDRRFGLVRGAEIVAGAGTLNGAGWVSNGDGTYTHTGATVGEVTFPATVIAGQLYEISFEILAGGTGSLTVAVGSAGGGFVSSTIGVQRCIVNGGTTVVPAVRFITTSTSLTIRPISAKPIPGNHATQSTAAARPVVRVDAGGHYYLAFDGVDDFLSSATGSGSAPITVMQALTYDALGTATNSFAAITNDGGVGLGKSSGNLLYFRTGTGAGTAGLNTVGAITAGVSYVFSGNSDGTNFSAQRNADVAVTATGVNPARATPGFTLGAWTAGSVERMQGRIYVHTHVGRVLSAMETANLRRFQASLGGVTL